MTKASDLTLEEQALLTSGRDMWSTAPIERLNVPSVKMADGPMGVASASIDERDVSLLMPCGTALAASWDVELASRVGEVVASEAHRRGIQAILGPNLNLPRSPLAGRAFETYSEDPFLSGCIGVAWLQGLQAHKVAAVAKHVVGNDSETQRHSMNSVMDERTLREVYLRPFQMAAEAGAWGLLMAYNRVNGLRNAEQRDVIGIIRNEWRWDGVLMSDWFGTHDGAASLNAGLDLEMPGKPRHMGPAAAKLVQDGTVPAQCVQDAAQHVMDFAAKVYQEPQQISVQAKEVLTEAAAAGFVLLKNDGNTLPFNVTKPLAVIGPNASVPCYQGATFARIALADDVLTPLDALRQCFAGVTYEEGVAPEFRLPPLPTLPITADSGESGLTVEYYRNGETEPVFSETRRTSTLVWFAEDMPAGLSTFQSGGIVARTTLTPEKSGVYRLYFGGTGDVRFMIDGQERGFQPYPVVDGDVMGHLLRAESEVLDVELAAGQAVKLEYHMTYQPARAQGIWFGAQPPSVPDLLERAAELARQTEQVVLIVGETADSGVESRDRTSTKLPDAQLELIEKVCAANPRTVVVLNVAHAVDTDWVGQAAAALHVWFPGQGFGEALADVLSGKREPGGRLPVTFARHEADYPAFDLTPDAQGDLPYREGVLIGYRSFAVNGTEPAFPLGFGLGYADIEWSEVRQAGVNVLVDLHNRSDRPGKEVVQLYLQHPVLEGLPEYPALIGFQAVTLAPGERRTVTLRLNPKTFEQWSTQHQKWVIQPGARALWAGRSLTDARWQKKFSPPV